MTEIDYGQEDVDEIDTPDAEDADGDSQIPRFEPGVSDLPEPVDEESDRDSMSMSERIEAIENDSLPAEYFAVQRIAGQADKQIATLPLPAPVDPMLHPFAAGEILDEYITQTIELEPAQHLYAKRIDVLKGIGNEARNRLQSIHQSAAPRILKALHHELQQLLREVKEVSDQLGSADTPQAAIAKDRGQQWKRLTDLADDYAELRRAQRRQMSGEALRTARSQSADASNDELASDLCLSNLDSLWPHWRQPGLDRKRAIRIGAGPEERPEPWPADHVGQLLWLVRRRAKPWIPTVRQLWKLHADRLDAANPNPRPIAGLIQGRPDQRKGTAS